MAAGEYVSMKAQSELVGVEGRIAAADKHEITVETPRPDRTSRHHGCAETVGGAETIQRVERRDGLQCGRGRKIGRTKARLQHLAGLHVGHREAYLAD